MDKVSDPRQKGSGDPSAAWAVAPQSNCRRAIWEYWLYVRGVRPIHGAVPSCTVRPYRPRKDATGIAPLRGLMSIAERCRNNRRRGHNCATWWPHPPWIRPSQFTTLTPEFIGPFPWKFFLIVLAFGGQREPNDRVQEGEAEVEALVEHGDESRIITRFGDSAKFDSEWLWFLPAAPDTVLPVT